jgi:site-specific DNA-methyltransferase (adenine-specific)
MVLVLIDLSFNENEKISRVYNMDCLEFLKEVPDNFFELCICDPPYGLNSKITGGHFKRYGDKQLNWDNSIPDDKYFTELYRVAKNQIIWGANYFPTLWGGGCRGLIFWDKVRAVENFSAGELAYTNFDMNLKIARIPYDGFIGRDEERIHPTQKPVALYKWLLEHYAKPGDKILDTHLGSQSSRIAAHQMGFSFWGCEIDEEYFKQGCERFEREAAQLMMFG